jgi:hypothetical protein
MHVCGVSCVQGADAKDKDKDKGVAAAARKKKAAAGDEEGGASGTLCLADYFKGRT